MIVAFFSNFKKGLIEFKRYWFNSVSGLVTILIFFYLIFFGFRAVGGSSPSFGETIDGIIVGYFMWLMFIFSFQGVAFGIIEDAQRGTLEQLFVSPIPFEMQILFRMVTDFCLNILLAIPLMYFAAFTTGRILSFDLPTLLYLMISGTMCALGIGLILGGVALIFKRVASFIQIVTFGSLALILFESNKIWHKFLPATQAVDMMRKFATTGTKFYQFPLSEHAVLWITALGYLALGLYVLKFFERKAMVRGTLSQY